MTLRTVIVCLLFVCLFVVFVFIIVACGLYVEY